MEVVGFVAAVLLLMASTPQLIAVVRGDARGVSLTSWWLFVASDTVWLMFGIKVSSPSLIFGNFAGVIAYAALVCVIIWKRRNSVLLVALVVPGVALMAVLAYAVPKSVTGLAGVVIGASLAVPQLLTSIKNWRRHEVTNVSLWTWAMVLTGQALWLIYGIALGEPAVITVMALSISAGTGVVIFQQLAKRSAMSTQPPIPLTSPQSTNS